MKQIPKNNHNFGIKFKVLSGHYYTPHINQDSEIWEGIFSPDGKNIATRGYDTVKVWNTESGELIRTLIAADETLKVSKFMFSPNNQYLATIGGITSKSGITNKTKVWDIETGALIFNC